MSESFSPTRDEIVHLVSELVSIESVNPSLPGSHAGEGALGAYVADHCERLGLEVTRQEVLPGRFNVLAELKVPNATRTLLLDGHLDTVSLGDMGDAGLRPEVRDDLLIGRGSCDDKGPLAAMLLALADLLRDPSRLRCNVLLLASIDEEYTMLGAQAFATLQRPVDGVIIAEPTRLDIVIAHKGVLRWQLHAQGKGAHSATPELGDNAIYQLAEAISLLRPQFERRLAGRTHALVGPGTWSVGRIFGGTASNVVPERCTFEADRRLLPAETVAEALAEIDEVLAAIRSSRPDLKLARDPQIAAFRGIDTSSDAPVVRALAQAAQPVLGQVPLRGVAYATNASKYAESGLSCVVFGPGDIAQAHTDHEYVSLRQVADAARVYAAAARAF